MRRHTRLELVVSQGMDEDNPTPKQTWQSPQLAYISPDGHPSDCEILGSSDAQLKPTNIKRGLQTVTGKHIPSDHESWNAVILHDIKLDNVKLSPY